MDSKLLLERVKTRRKQRNYTLEEYRLIRSIQRETSIGNNDNISRTKSYLDYYKRHPEMEWALLASMVSRNAGWNMTDLSLEPIYKLLSDFYLKILFHTYERPNWLIFHDAFPQLLLYAASIKWERPLFHLLKAFDVSIFMEIEWEMFWQTRDSKRISYALIVNEQHVIQKPVVEHRFYGNKVFEHILFKVEEAFRLNAVVFPDMHGELYGFSVTHFRNVESRINLGKRLHTLLFHVNVSEQIKTFGLKADISGDRFDYEKFHGCCVSNHLGLKDLYPIIKHRRLVVKDWFNGQILEQWFMPPVIKDYHLTDWYRKKRQRLSKLGNLLAPFIGKKK